jgi:membrane protein DedA with SNARE-associated domain
MVPGIREIISIPAGIAEMNFAKFVGYTFAGSVLWCTILTLAGYYLGEAWSKFSEQASSVFTIVTLIVSAILIAGISYWYKVRKGASVKQ